MNSIALKDQNAIVSQIDRRSNLSGKELYEEYIKPQKPVILTDAIDNWALKGKISPQFFKENYGQLKKTINGVEYTLAECVDLIMSSTAENPAPYPCNLNVDDYFPELLKGFQPEILYGKSDRIHHPLLPRFLLNGTEIYEIFLGGAGAGFPYLHYDALFMHTQITQLYGSKEFYFYTPEQSAYLYPKPDSPKVSQVNIFDVDEEKFPLFKEVKPIIVTVEEGETILFPTGWWHTTRIHEPNVTLGRAQLNASNWNLFMRDNYRLWKQLHPNFKQLGLPVLLYGHLLGKLIDLQEMLQ